MLFLLLFQLYADVAVIDSGISSHVRHTSGWNFSKNEETYGNDPYNHGSFIAFIIGYKNDYKIYDLVYGEKHIPLINEIGFPENSLSLFRYNKHMEGLSDEVADAILWSINKKVKVINFSSSSYFFKSKKLKDAIKKAEDNNIFLVVASGNEAENLNEHPTYPCSLDFKNIICVEALEQGKRTYSNYGKDVDIFVDLNFKNFKGTSFAAPFISRYLRSSLDKKSYRDILAEIKKGP